MTYAIIDLDTDEIITVTEGNELITKLLIDTKVRTIFSGKNELLNACRKAGLQPERRHANIVKTH